MKKLLVVLVILIGGLLLAGGWLGVVPGLSALLVRQVDLGVKSDPQLVTALNEKLGMTGIPGTMIKTRDGDLVYSGQQAVDVKISSEEATSALNRWASFVSWSPYRNAQVRFNADGTAEISALFRVSAAVELAQRLGYNAEQIELAKKFVGVLGEEMPVYVKGTGQIKNNQVTLNPSQLKIGNIAIPSQYAAQAAVAAADAVERRRTQIEGLSIESLTNEAGQAKLIGMMPEKTE